MHRHSSFDRLPPHLNPLPRRGEETERGPLALLKGEGQGEGSFSSRDAPPSNQMRRSTDPSPSKNKLRIVPDWFGIVLIVLRIYNKSNLVSCGKSPGPNGRWIPIPQSILVFQ